MLLALLLLPVIGSALVFSFKCKTSRYVALTFAAFELVLSTYMLSGLDFAKTIDSSQLQYSIDTPEFSLIEMSLHLGIDGLSMLFVLLTTVLTFLIVLSSFSQKVKYNNNFYALILLMQFGLIGVFSSLDGLVFYAFWEITLIPIWFICGLWGQEDQRIKVTTKFFVYTFVGSLFMLGGLIYVYSNSASFAILDMYNSDLNATEQVVVFWAIFLAFAVKLPIFPFNTWQADTYTYSPTEGTMLLSGIMLKMAIFGILRYLLPIVPDAISGLSGKIVFTLAVVSVVYGALIAIVKNDIKRILAYSSLSHMGLVLAGIFASVILTLNGVFTTEGAEGAVVQSFAHGINIVGLFYCADVLQRRFGSRNIKEMGGFAKVAPKFAILFLVIVFGSMAVPLTNGFIGEFILLKSIADHNLIAVVMAGLTIIFCAVYMLRLYGKTMFGEANSLVMEMKDVSVVEFTVLLTLVAFVVFFGLFPNGILEMVKNPLEFIFQSINK